MEKCDQSGQLAEAIAAFDTLYTTNHMQMLKLLSPYLDIESRHKLAMFIKWQELLYTMNFSQHYPRMGAKYSRKKEPDISSLISLLSPYCSEREKNMLLQFSQIQGMMKTYQDIAQYLPMLQELMGSFSPEQVPFGGAGSPSDSGAMIDMLKGMLSEEQQGLFSMFMEGGIHDQ